MISAIGGTLGLFTGISVITLVEVFYWSICFGLIALKRVTANARNNLRNNFIIPSFNTARSTNNAADSFTADTHLQMTER